MSGPSEARLDSFLAYGEHKIEWSNGGDVVNSLFA